MKYALIPVLVGVALLAGCVTSVPAGFFPVQGPLSKQSPAPSYKASVSGVIFSGSVSLVLDDGEVCKGTWALVSKSASAQRATAAAEPAPPNMSADWDSVYGPGYYVAHVVGNRLYARALLTGNMGTVLNVEFSNENNTRGNTKGVARDNKGNLFKVTVYN